MSSGSVTVLNCTGTCKGKNYKDHRIYDLEMKRDEYDFLKMQYLECVYHAVKYFYCSGIYGLILRDVASHPGGALDFVMGGGVRHKAPNIGSKERIVGKNKG